MRRPWNRRSLHFAGAQYKWRQIESGVEDVFIHLMESSKDKVLAMKTRPQFSLRRFWAMVVKEFVQMRRDRMTFGIMIGHSAAAAHSFRVRHQFGPQASPCRGTACGRRPARPHLLNAIENSSYFDFVRRVQTEEEGYDMLARGEVQFVINIPQNFTRDLLRGDRPAILVEADATDPAATSNALGALAIPC